MKAIVKTEQSAGAYAVTDMPVSMYYQTIHRKPIATGYVSRVPAREAAHVRAVNSAYDEHRYRDLRDRLGVRYLVAPPGREVLSDLPGAVLMYRDPGLALYDLGCPPRAPGAGGESTAAGKP